SPHARSRGPHSPLRSRGSLAVLVRAVDNRAKPSEPSKSAWVSAWVAASAARIFFVGVVAYAAVGLEPFGLFFEVFVAFRYAQRMAEKLDVITGKLAGTGPTRSTGVPLTPSGPTGWPSLLPRTTRADGKRVSGGAKSNRRVHARSPLVQRPPREERNRSVGLKHRESS